MATDLAGQEAPETGAPRPRRVSTGVKWDERCQIPPHAVPRASEPGQPAPRLVRKPKPRSDGETRDGTVTPAAGGHCCGCRQRKATLILTCFAFQPRVIAR